LASARVVCGGYAARRSIVDVIYAVAFAAIVAVTIALAWFCGTLGSGAQS